MKQFLLKLVRDEQGQDLVEYALIVAAVGLALISTVNQLSTAVVSSVLQHHAGFDQHRRVRAIDLRKLLVPDAAFVCAILTLVYCLFLGGRLAAVFS